MKVRGVPTPTGSDRAACLRLAGGLPASLDTGLNRRRVTPDTSFAAAWGSPPVVLSCGITGRPAAYRPDAQLQEVNGIGWFAEEVGDTVRYTAVERRPQVVLVVPRGRDQTFEILVSLAGPVRGATVAVQP